MTVGVAIQADTNYTKIDNALYVIPLGMYVLASAHGTRHTPHRTRTHAPPHTSWLTVVTNLTQDVGGLLSPAVASHSSVLPEVVELPAAADHHGTGPANSCSGCARVALTPD
jgi:hypothetical protein